MSILPLNLRSIRLRIAPTGLLAALVLLSPTPKAGLIPGNGLPPGTIPPVKSPGLPSPSPIPNLPDLVAPSLILGAPVLEDGVFRVPFTATIANIGRAPAGTFVVAGEYMDPGFAPGAWFLRACHPEISYGVTATYDRNAQVARLPAGFALTLKGNFYFGLNARGRTLHLRLHVDDGESTEFLPAYTRVKESNELNNNSPQAWVSFPG